MEEIRQKISANTSMIPDELRIALSLGEKPKDSAVLVPLIIHQELVSLLYTLRSNSLDRHKGQVSFPGGLIEATDSSAIETALRETWEEISIENQSIQVVGQLNPINTSTGYIVYPVIGIVENLEMMNRNRIEVDRIFCIPLEWLCDPSHSRIKEYVTPEGETRPVWFFDVYDGELLWGITAKITKDLLKLIKK